LFKSSGITVESIPTLEVQFLLFNINSQILDEPVEREVIIKSINKDILAVRLGEYARTVSQFVSNGVYGYNPNLVKEYYDPDVAKQMAFGEGMNGGVVDVHLLTGLDVLGQLIRDSLVYVNIIPEIGYLDIENLKKSIDSQVADIYFMGFKSTFGDAQEFLDSVAHSKGVNNIFGYKNPKVDELIEEARVEMDNKQRLGSLQKALEIIVEEDIIGYPLIEYETLFGFKNYIQYEPRIDGLIYYDDISYKQ